MSKTTPALPVSNKCPYVEKRNQVHAEYKKNVREINKQEITDRLKEKNIEVNIENLLTILAVHDSYVWSIDDLIDSGELKTHMEESPLGKALGGD